VLFGTGLIWAVVLLLVDVQFLLWMMPIIGGLLLSPLLFKAASSRNLGQKARSLGLFVVPEEQEPPKIVAATDELERRLQAAEPPVEKKSVLLPPEQPTSMPVNPLFESL
jgi:membrane glycosyltransferase